MDDIRRLGVATGGFYGFDNTIIAIINEIEDTMDCDIMNGIDFMGCRVFFNDDQIIREFRLEGRSLFYRGKRKAVKSKG